MARRLRDPAVLALSLFAALVVLGFAAKLIPSLLKETTATSSTPVRREVAGDYPFALAPTQRACLSEVPFDRDGGVAHLWVQRVPAAGAELRVTAAAPGYRAAGRLPLTARVAQPDDPPVAIPLAPPERSVVGTFCVRNEGPAAVVLVGTDQPRALVRSTATIDGAPQRAAFSLSLVDDTRRDTIARTSQLVDRAAALSPFGTWLFWVLIPLLALGLPLLVGAALLRALREES